MYLFEMYKRNIFSLTSIKRKLNWYKFGKRVYFTFWDTAGELMTLKSNSETDRKKC